jgi:transposase
MGLADSQGPAPSETSPPPWWTVDGAAIPLESLETGPLPDGNRPEDIKKLQDLVRSLARELRLTRERLEQELKHRYKPHSEKRPRGDGDGAPDKPAGGESGASPDGNGTPSGGKPPKKKKPHGRRPIPPGLPKVNVPIPLEDARCKTCGGPTHELQCVESCRFDYVPGYIRVLVLQRSRRACDDSTCTDPFLIADLPPEPIPKGRATAGFLAHLLVSKFADHIPIYRFAKILLRQNVDLPRSTLVDYCKKSTKLLKLLWELMKKRVLKSAIIQTDDTHVQVRLPRKKGVLTGHLWAYKGDDAHPYVVFEFTRNWEGTAPQAFLETFEGYIQADGYKGYHELFKNPRRVLVGCMAHARRKWWKARDTSATVANQALDMIDALYAIEKTAKDLTPDERKRVRQEQAAPILEKLRIWIDEQAGRILPKSPVAKAITYAKNQWTALTRYLEDGRLSIDNNAIERELRRVALGRKNWLAAGSEVGGETAAIGYTMIASALTCGVDPVEWLTDVLTRIVTCPPDRLEELLPDRWKAARDAERRAREAASSEAAEKLPPRASAECARHEEGGASATPPAPPSPPDTADHPPPAPASSTTEPGNAATASVASAAATPGVCARADDRDGHEHRGHAQHAPPSAGSPGLSPDTTHIDEPPGPEANGPRRTARAPP